VVVVFLNNGYYYRKRPVRDGIAEPEFYTLPAEFIKANHQKALSGWERVLTKGKDMENYKNERGFEIIAQDLKIPYPGTEGEE